jgi:hypothetical protein
MGLNAVVEAQLLKNMDSSKEPEPTHREQCMGALQCIQRTPSAPHSP